MHLMLLLINSIDIIIINFMHLMILVIAFLGTFIIIII